MCLRVQLQMGTAMTHGKLLNMRLHKVKLRVFLSLVTLLDLIARKWIAFRKRVDLKTRE